MVNDRGILIKNIYYMLTYAFQVLRQSNYESVAAEEFDNIHDMFAAILERGIAQQLKHGLHKEYVNCSEELTTMRGKLDLQGTIKQQVQRRRVLSCTFDELSENNLMNQILKITVRILVKEKSVRNERRAALKRSLLFFDRVDDISPSGIRWDSIQYHRNNQRYRMLLNVCRLIIEGLLICDAAGIVRLAKFLDDQSMSHLYEKFILEYYRYHHPELRPNPVHVKWNLDDDNDLWLPDMITDVTLKKEGKTLILDAKYYGRQMQSNHDVQKFRNDNLYQIYAYVKNMDVNHDGSIAGMLLYAKTGETFQPGNQFRADGNRIMVNSLDLSVPFPEIARQLEAIVQEYFG